MNSCDKLTFHDPLAAAVIFDDQICKFSRGKVDMELVSERVLGMTYWSPNEVNEIHDVTLEVDGNRFLKHYFNVVQDICV